MEHSKEYIEGIFQAAKQHLPDWVWKGLHKIAFPRSGGAARWRDLNKQVAPMNSRGNTAAEVIAQRTIRGEPFSKTEVVYEQPTTDPVLSCGACRFYLRYPGINDEFGGCQVVMGTIAWFGTCALQISAEMEAAFSLSSTIQKQGFEIQTIVFPKSKWTLARARRWLSEHDFKTPAVDETTNSYRFRQQSPGQFARIRPTCLTPSGAAPNLESCSVLAFGGPIEKADTGLTQEDIDEEIDKMMKEYTPGKRKRKKPRMEKEIPILKVDEEKRIVYGVVLDPYIVDTQGDWSPPSEVEKTAHGWMENSRTIGLGHRKEADAVPVESFLMPYPSDEDYSKAMKNDPHKVYKFKFGSGFVHSGSWVLGTKVNDDATWKLVKSGELGAYSIGGHGARSEIDKGQVPKPTEVIEVDWSKAKAA